MSSSSEDSDAGPKRKRKLRRLEDSPGSTSSGSPILGSSSAMRRIRAQRVVASDWDTSGSSSGSPILTNHRRKKVKITSDSNSDSSDDSEIGRGRVRRSRRLSSDSHISDGSFSSQWESDYSESENVINPEPSASAAAPNNNSDSDFSDGQSEKCPICLASFKVQEISTPESCDHTFCLECIQEWSKNMNTCPVDRQEFSLILVRDSLNGKVTRQIPIERPVPQNEVDIFEDPTYCEICGSTENEDRMLLCDGCDLGFHLYCLTPPLQEVPFGFWYCNECSPNDRSSVSDNDVSQMISDEVNRQFRRISDEVDRQLASRRRTLLRLIPRTRQTERVRRRIVNNRHQTSLSNTPSSTQSSNVFGNTHVVTSSTSKPSKRTKTRKPRKRTAKIKYHTVYEIDKVTGETVAKKKRMKKKTKTSRNYRNRSGRVKPKTVKKRLAQQLGICAPRTSTQNLPDVKIPVAQNNPSHNISGMRHSAGIPTLHLFGHNNELDYFSEDNEDYSLGSQLMIRRAPNQSDISTMRRNIQRKNIVVHETVSSTSDLLDSILNTQEQFYARNASYSLDSSGKFKVDTKKSYIDVTKEHKNAKETPYYPNNRNYNNRYNQNYRYNQNRYQNQRQSNNYHSSNQNYYHSEPSSSMNYSSFSGSSGGDDNDIPQDYSQRTLCATAESNVQNNQEDNEEEEEQAGEPGNNANSESELDIYSDIETVSTSRVEENDPKPPSPPIISHNTGTDEDNNDSEPEMVIDDEKVQEQESQTEYNREETAVTSTVGLTRHFEQSMPSVPHNSMEIQSEAVQSSSLDDSKSYQYYNDDSSDGCPNANVYSRENSEVQPVNDEDVDSDDGCPNFSIYSKESKTLALHTDISLPTERAGSVDYQVGVVSSNIVPTNDSYDPEQIYESEQNAEETGNDPEQTYDPEKIYEGDSTYNPDQTYDPETCLHRDEMEKRFDADQSYDPEKIYEEESNSNDKTCDYEKEVFKYNTSLPNITVNSIDLDVSNIGDRYDPAVPFSDDLDESKCESQKDKPVAEDNPESDSEDLDSQKEKQSKDVNKPIIKGGILGGLYSDSEDDSVVKKENSAFAISDINHMTEDISEEERSYTPCLDEKFQKQGLEGLETEMISDEDRNDFDESHELKTVSDGDALEINAKESELDFTRPEDYEEGEIVDKNKGKEVQSDEPEVEDVCEEQQQQPISEKPPEEKKNKKKEKEKPSTEDKSGNKENEGVKDSSFRKLSKNTKERNYRDKEKRRSSPKSRSKDRDYNKKDRKKEKRKELERYNVRAIIAEKPRPLIAKDQFGRDIRNTPSRSRSHSYTPPIRRSSSRPVRSPSKTRRSRSRSRRSLSRRRKSPSKDKSRKRRKSKNFRSISRSKSRSPIKKGPASKSKKRKRSTSRFRKRKSGDLSKNKKRLRSRSRHMSRSASPAARVQRDWERRAWTPMSPSPPRISPSWTPPRAMDNSQLLRNENLTVTVNNSNKKKRDKKRRGEKRNKEGLESRQKKRRHERERTPPPSKEVFASGDNILVSVSFNNENETRDVSTRDKRKNDDNKKRKEKRKKNKRDLTGVKPVAIIDLDRSPFRELTPSPKQVIILTDSDNEDNDARRNVQDNICDSSQQVASPERGIGPKTPPEPQVKFSLAAKPPQIRAINNPLHDPEDMETNDNVEDELDSRMGPGIHIGPNTPPEPPNSPPSSPDAYDPFEPTKSRSPTPDRQPQSVNKDSHESVDSRVGLDSLEKSINPVPEVVKSLTPPLADIQPADSQSSIQVTPDSNLDKSPDRSGSSLQVVQQLQSSKPVAQTIPFSSVPTSMITSTPNASNIPISRINILNSTIITQPVASSIPQRIVLPNQVKSSPVKISPTKASVKSTPIKPITNKINKVTRKRVQNGTSDDIILDFDSPYSPGSSDYEDLFEPPSDIVTKPVIKNKTKSSQKHSSFDALFGSPSFIAKQKNKKVLKKNTASSKTKTVGVKLDEDNLKILDELPNSAVEMQVKDKFLKKLNRQERVVEEVKLVLKPHYNKKRINKEEYKDIMRRSVPKICHNKSGEINPTKIKNLIEAYVRKIKHSKKVTSSSSVNPQKM